MRDIADTILSELSSKEFRIFYLLELEIEGTSFYYTDCDVAITIKGHVYEPRSFRVSDIGSSEETIVDKLTLELDNIDDAFTSMLVGGSPRGSTIKYSLVALDEDYQVVTQDVVSGELLSYWEASEIGGIRTIGVAGGKVGMWEYCPATAGYMPSDTIDNDLYWDKSPITNGIRLIA